MKVEIASSKKQITATITGEPWQINQIIQKVNLNKIARNTLMPSGSPYPQRR